MGTSSKSSLSRVGKSPLPQGRRGIVALHLATRNKMSREGAVGGCQPELGCGGELVNKGTREKFMAGGAGRNSGCVRVSGQSRAEPWDQHLLRRGCVVSALEKAESSLGLLSRPGRRTG